MEIKEYIEQKKKEFEEITGYITGAKLFVSESPDDYHPPEEETLDTQRLWAFFEQSLTEAHNQGRDSFRKDALEVCEKEMGEIMCVEDYDRALINIEKQIKEL